MTIWTKKELLEALKDEVLKHNVITEIVIDEVVIDSRKALKNSLFIAIEGEKNDGHDYLEQAYANGCALSIIHDKNKIPNSPFILVKNSFIALYKLAEYSRQRTVAKIIAVTGSVGKTGTKEMLKLAFDTQGKTFATIGNLNNHFGLPLSLCNFAADCEFGIFEIGMNHLGEIEPLSKLVKPDLALITNVASVHIEFFKNEQEIALAKSEIFSGLGENGIALINYDNIHFNFLERRSKSCKIKAENIVSFGKKDKSNYQLLDSKIIDADNSEISVKLKNGEKISYQISTSHDATIFNSIIVVACLDLLGKDLKSGILAFKKVAMQKGRGKISQVEVDKKNILIIDDSYNASIASIKAGIEYAVKLKNNLGKKRVVVALGDMLELGDKSDDLHQKVMQIILENKVDFAILVGEKMTKNCEILDKNSYKTFMDSLSASQEIKGLLNDGDILYVKGSRGMKMEKCLVILEAFQLSRMVSL